MTTHLPAFETSRVLVVGDVMLDRYWHGATSRISPEAPVPVVRVDQAEDRPGGAANVALNIAALGAHVVLLGLTGEDDSAQLLQQRLHQAGVECRFQTLPGQPTITKLRVLSRHQQLIRLDFERGFHDVDLDALEQDYRAAISGVGAVVLSDYGKGTLARARAWIAAAREAGTPVLVDPKGRDFSVYHGATVITPNLGEFEAVVGPCRDEQHIAEKALRLMDEHDFGAVLVTRGEHGMTLVPRHAAALHLAARAREVYDVTGAGDTVISTLAAALAAGSPLPVAMALANVAAGVVVGKLGTATVSVSELRQALRDDAVLPQGVVDEDPLVNLVREAQAHGETVVMTNGCFDILHAGHVAYLQQAKRLGDRLIVAVNDDASVARLKGPERPINPLDQRMTVLSALGCVDWVVPFSEDTPQRLICRVAPDVLVKGGDYQPQQIAGHDCVTANGGRVVVLAFVAGCSTTRVIDAIRGRPSR